LQSRDEEHPFSLNLQHQACCFEPQEAGSPAQAKGCVLQPRFSCRQHHWLLSSDHACICPLKQFHMCKGRLLSAAAFSFGFPVGQPTPFSLQHQAFWAWGHVETGPPAQSQYLAPPGSAALVDVLAGALADVLADVLLDVLALAPSGLAVLVDVLGVVLADVLALAPPGLAVLVDVLAGVLADVLALSVAVVAAAVVLVGAAGAGVVVVRVEVGATVVRVVVKVSVAVLVAVLEVVVALVVVALVVVTVLVVLVVEVLVLVVRVLLVLVNVVVVVVVPGCTQPSTSEEPAKRKARPGPAPGWPPTASTTSTSETPVYCRLKPRACCCLERALGSSGTSTAWPGGSDWKVVQKRRGWSASTLTADSVGGVDVSER